MHVQHRGVLVVLQGFEVVPGEENPGPPDAGPDPLRVSIKTYDIAIEERWWTPARPQR